MPDFPNKFLQAVYGSLENELDATPYRYYRLGMYGSKEAQFSGAIQSKVETSIVNLYANTGKSGKHTISQAWKSTVPGHASPTNILDNNDATSDVAVFPYVVGGDARIWQGAFYEFDLGSAKPVREVEYHCSTSTNFAPFSLVLWGTNNSEALVSNWVTYGISDPYWTPLFGISGLKDTWSISREKNFTYADANKALTWHRFDFTTHTPYDLQIAEMSIWKDSNTVELTEADGPYNARGFASPTTDYQPHLVHDGSATSPDFWATGGISWANAGFTEAQDAFLIYVTRDTDMPDTLRLQAGNTANNKMPARITYKRSTDGYTWSTIKDHTSIPSWGVSESRTFSLEA